VWFALTARNHPIKVKPVTGGRFVVRRSSSVLWSYRTADDVPEETATGA
jgi:hypothetical protein